MTKLFKLFILALCAISAYGDVSLTIDCGSSGGSIESTSDGSSLIWSGDDDLIQNGENYVVQTSSKSKVMDTLRVFTTRKKNCYTFSADKNQQVLVRASFYYGNYDKKSAPPTFDLQFNGNHWTSVETAMDELVYHESIYVLQMDGVSICLAQTKDGQFPFISALEIRSLESTMYNFVSSEFALFLTTRIAYGAEDVIRDAYDRLWIPSAPGTGLIKATSDAIFIETQYARDQPPQAAVQNAITASDASTSISVISANAVDSDKLLYVNFYFSEVAQLESSERRSFRIVDNDTVSDPIVPVYANASQFYYTNFTVTSSGTIYLIPTTDSTLAPLINAIEVFYISDPITTGTHSDDVDGLSALQNSFDVLNEWSGDPCLPLSYTWEWVNCSSAATPRITALHLSGFGLSGLLPDFSSMDSVETIDLHNNSISGPIPDFLGAFPNLKQLNLADNQFTGPIPASLSSNNKLKLVVTGNPNLCTSGKSCENVDTTISTGSNFPTSPSSGGTYTKKKKSKLPVILGSSITSFIVFWAIAGTLAIFHHKRKTAAVAAASAGQQNGANKPNGNAQGQAFVNEFKVNMDQNNQNDDNVEMQDQDTSNHEADNSERHV